MSKGIMRALVLESHGGLENLKVVNDHKIPAVVEGQVLIRVRASSFNYHDVFTVRGMPGIKVPLPVVIGLDIAGDRVLVLGASGGVGTGCVLLAKLAGAEVIACAGGEEKMGRLRDLGADHVIDYKKVDFSKWAIETYGKPQRRTYEGGVDVVVNFTGGDSWVPSLRCLKRGGKLLVCGATAGHDPKEDLRYIWSFELQVIGSNSFYDDNLTDLMRLISEKKLKPVVDKVLPLDRAVEGLRLIENREVLGKVIVAP